MPFRLNLIPRLRKAGWKVKIYDFERLEPPHITILFKSRSWRLSLRDGEFLDEADHWNQIDDDVRQAVEAGWDALREAWDRMHPDNPLSSQNDDDN